MPRLFLVLAFLLFAVALPAAAQRGPGGRATPEQMEARLDARVAQLDSALALSDEQATALKELLTEQMREMMALREGGRPDRAQMNALREGHQKAIEALLTPEQIEPYRAFVEKERANNPRRGRRGNG